ncbi:MAG: right-handed parallel beta-helix repeat-containing protein [Methanobrevibacter sp.]|uniref:right-handed parallel beta-helix repeat-containing protein n=1 Tax=Methanobrevibacter sp. TaxID=66852 RepID=UPI001B7738D3|nr:right-handed parallel beta-helix repeat-containing protein [Methanobrevibacter sp.]MBP3791637.1 right-handed parallel beta-helix repeat-containing protein [Methanobrevibacter sp.]
MKISKSLLISVLLVLVMLCIIGTASAAEPLNGNLTTTDSGGDIDEVVNEDLSISDSQDKLSAAGDTITVDAGGSGDYQTISDAVGAASGGETIFIKNGEYKETKKIDIGTKQLTFTGESADGVIITSGDNDLFYTTGSGSCSLVFNNLIFKDISMTGARVPIFIGGNDNVNITNCVFDNCASRYGALRIFTSGNVVVDQCKFLGTKSSTGSYSSAIDFGGSGETEYVLKNSIIDNSGISDASTASYILGAIYIEKSAGTTILDNVTISNFQGNGKGRALITAKGNTEIKNSKIINNQLSESLAYNALFFINTGGKTVTIETSMIANNSEPNYIVASNSATSSFNLNYNNIQNNTVKLGVNHLSSGSYTLDANYWGSNALPDGVTASTWIVENNGAYELNTGEVIDVTIPGLNDGPEPTYPEGTIYVSKEGNDENNGSEDSPVLTIAKGMELANAGSGFLVIKEGKYLESNIALNNTKPITITGEGNVEIDGQASTTSIFVMDGGEASFTNIKFTNNKPKYGGAINLGSNEVIAVLIDNCTFADINSTSRGGAIYGATVKGKLTVKNSNFYNIDSGSWGAITIATSSQADGLTVDISGSNFENNKANNGAALYLRAANVNIVDSTFVNNTAANAPGAIYLYNATATIDNCIISNNTAGAKGVAISTTPVSGSVTKLTITNSIIENNNGNGQVLPAIYADMNMIDISYSSLINELSIETRTATGYDAVYGQGVVIANNNWWGVNDPADKVTGKNITVDSWVIMNVEANATEVLPGDEVKLTIDFNHVNTTSGEVQELTGGEIPIDSYTVKLTSQNGTFSQDEVVVKKGMSQNVIFTSSDSTALITATSGDATVDIILAKGVEPYYGVIYVSTEGNDNNNGSEEAPVSSIAKAIELASINGGSGEIIVNAGTYTGANYEVTKDLTITGVGDVVLNAEGQGKLFNVAYSANVAKLSLANLTLTGGNANYGSVIYSYAKELILENVNVINNPTSGNLITNNGKLTVSKSKFANNTCGDVIKSSGNYDITITDSTFENNTVTDSTSDYGILYISSGKGNLIVENSKFINNIARQGILIGASDTIIDVKGSEFINNTNTVSYGGAIRASSKLTVTESKFINNQALRDGGAIYVGFRGDATVTKSVFINNTVTSSGYHGDAIYNGNKLFVNYCVLLTNGTKYLIYNDGEDNVVNAQYNWWGTNDNPKSLNGVGSYEDDWGDDMDCAEVDSSNWVVMTVSNNITGDLDVGDKVEFTVDFTHDVNKQALADSIPEVDVEASAVYGELNKDKATTENNVAKFVFTATDGGVNNVTITSSDAVNTTALNVKEPIVLEVIYVSMSGDDNNIGSRDAPVATIKHAMEIAEKGKIVILNGNYVITETLVVNKDLDISGQGTVVINGNELRIIENTANLNLTNIVFTNAKSSVASVLSDDGNTIITNCSFYSNKATSTSGGNLINNKKGTMVIDNCDFSENVASRGVIGSQSGTELLINNSEFIGNDMTSLATTYGIIYSTSADTVVENTVFRNNKAKIGGAIYATRATSSTTGTLEINNCTFDNNTALQGQGGAIFAGRTPTTIKDSTFTNNQAISGSYAKGQGGAIYQTIDDTKSTMSIDNCVFVNNTAGDTGSAIYVNTDQGTFDIANSVIINKEGDDSYAIDKKDKATTVITADNNYWGNNTKANVDISEDSKITLDVTVEPKDAVAGDEITITAVFSSEIPDGVEVGFTSDSGKLNEVVLSKGKEITFKYTVDEADKEILVSLAGVPQFTLLISEIPDVIYVSPEGDDANDGSMENPVKTLAHAIEIAKKGQIVLSEGTYKTGDLGIISKDLNITGEGKVVIDADNSNRILYVGEDAKVVLKNLIMINGFKADESGALLGNSNYLTLINCTLANSTAGEFNGGAIYNVGYLTVINSTIANNTAKLGGAIYSGNSLAKGATIVIENSVIENNIANGNDNNGGGAIFAQQIAGMTIDNTTFKDNKALTTSSGGAIFVSHSEAEMKITNSEFIANHANGKEGTGGGAIYMAGTSNYERKGKLTISDTLFENNTADANGGAIYARATTVNVEKSVFINNADENGIAVYGYKTEQTSPSMTANKNWWGTNDDPKEFIGGNSNYKPTMNNWAVLTITNDTEIKDGNTVKLTVTIDSYTDGETVTKLDSPIKVSMPVTISTNKGDIEGVLTDGEFTYDLDATGIKFISANVGGVEEVLFANTVDTTISIEDVTASKGDEIEYTVTVTSADGTVVNKGIVELYFDSELVKTMDVIDGVAKDKVFITKEPGKYNITAKYIDETAQFANSEENKTLTVSGINNIVTPENFHNFFDENGVLKEDVPFDEIIFKGTFDNLGVITINDEIKLTGDGAVFNNASFKLNGDNIELSNVAIVLDKNFAETDGAAVYVGGDNVVLSNNNITYNAPDNVQSYAISVDVADDVKIINNNINYSAKSDGNVKTIAINAVDSDNLVVEDNVLNANIPSVDIDYSAFPTIEYNSQGVHIENSDNVSFNKNDITVNYNDATGYDDTIYAVHFDNSDDSRITNNAIELNGHKHAYGLVTNDCENITISGNDIKSNSDDHYAAGLQVGGESTAVVDNNNISAKAKDVTYPVYLDDWENDGEVNLTNNHIKGESDTVYGVYVEENKTLIAGNTIDAEGNHVYGVVTHQTDAVIDSNNITANGKDVGDIVSPQSGVDENTTGIIVSEGSAEITNNNVVTTGKSTIAAINTNATIKNNGLTANGTTADKSIKNINSNVVTEGNTAAYEKSENTTPAKKPVIKITAKNNAKVDYGFGYKVRVTQDGKSVGAGKVVTLKIAGKTLKAKTDKNGYATFNLAVKPKAYAVTVTYNKVSQKYKVTVKNVIKAKKLKVKKSAKKLKVKVTLKTSAKKPIAGKKVILKIKSKKLKAKTNKKGVAKFKVKKNVLKKLKAGKKYKYKVIYGKDKVKKTLKVKK